MYNVKIVHIYIYIFVYIGMLLSHSQWKVMVDPPSQNVRICYWWLLLIGMCVYEQIHTYLYTNKYMYIFLYTCTKKIYIYTRYAYIYIYNMQLPFGVPIGLFFFFFFGFFNKNNHLLRGFMSSI